MIDSAPPPPAVPSTQLPRNVWVATLASFLTDISSEMLVNVLPLFLANVLGVSTAVIGLIEGLAETTSSLLKGWSGWFSDRLGQRKWLAVGGYGLSAVVKPLWYFATGWGMVLAVRFADRVGKGLRTAPRDALIADSVEPHQRGRAFGLHRAGDTAGAMVGLMLALGVVWASQSEALALSRDTFQKLVLLSIVPAFLAVALLTWGLQEVKRPPSAATGWLKWRGLRPQLQRFLAAVALFTLGNSSDGFLVLRAQERGLSVVGVLGMLITFNLVYATLSGPLGILSDRIGRKRLIVAGWLIYSVLYMAFAMGQTTWHIWLTYALYGVYYAAFEGTAKAHIADLVTAEERGTVYGYYNALIGLMALPGSLLAGILWQGVGAWAGWGPAAPFWAGAVLSLAAVGVLVSG